MAKKVSKTKASQSLFSLLDASTKELTKLQKKLPKLAATKAPKKAAVKAVKAAAKKAAGGAAQTTWTRDQVWQEVSLSDNIIPINPPPPVGKQTPMAQVLLRISLGLLVGRLNITFFSSPHQNGEVSVALIGACNNAGNIASVICNKLALQGRLV